jgi:hypothetical protein
MLTKGPKAIFGVPKKIPHASEISGVPEGARIKIKFRNNRFARAFVLKRGILTYHIIEEMNGRLLLSEPIEYTVSRKESR